MIDAESLADFLKESGSAASICPRCLTSILTWGRTAAPLTCHLGVSESFRSHCTNIHNAADFDALLAKPTKRQTMLRVNAQGKWAWTEGEVVVARSAEVLAQIESVTRVIAEYVNEGEMGKPGQRCEGLVYAEGEWMQCAVRELRARNRILRSRY